MGAMLYKNIAIVVTVLCMVGAIGSTAAPGTVTAMNATTSTGPLTGPDAAAGPLVVSEANPRYCTVARDNAAGERVVNLTGSHMRFCI